MRKLKVLSAKLYYIEATGFQTTWFAVIEAVNEKVALHKFTTKFKVSNTRIPKTTEINITELQRPCFVIQEKNPDGKQILLALRQQVEHTISERLARIEKGLLHAFTA